MRISDWSSDVCSSDLERLDIGAGSGAGVDEEIGVLLADLRAADHQPAAAGRVDKLPRLAPLGVLEGRTAGFRAQRLRRFAARRDTIHLGLDGGGELGSATWWARVCQ